MVDILKTIEETVNFYKQINKDFNELYLAPDEWKKALEEISKLQTYPHKVKSSELEYMGVKLKVNYE